MNAKKRDAFILSEDQWDLMAALVQILRPFYDATNQVCSATATLSSQLAIAHLLYNDDSLSNAPENLKPTVQSIRNLISEKFFALENSRL
jgi:hypothetical protein